MAEERPPAFLTSGGLTVTGPRPGGPPPAQLGDPNGALAAELRPGSVHVRLGEAAVAENVSDAALETELRRELAALGAAAKFELYNKGAYKSRPFAMVNFEGPLAHDGEHATLAQPRPLRSADRLSPL